MEDNKADSSPPKRPFKFFVDLDPIAYSGASCGEQTMYRWSRYEDGISEPVEFSDAFTKANDAKDWINSEVWDEDIEALGWKRESWVITKPLKDALGATKHVINAYIKTCEKNCRAGKEPIISGFLTPSGKKTKDLPLLENRYQFNREGKERPLYMRECREYVLSNFPDAKMAPSGFEADAPVIAMTERSGEDGCLLSIDKDLKQVENAWYIDTNNLYPVPIAEFSAGIGELHEEVNFRGKSSYRGCGFKFLCFQCVVGDISDGYKGLNLIGPKKVYPVLVDCNTKKGCVLAIREFYKAKFKRGYICKKLKALGNKPDKGKYQYISWDGVHCSPSINEIMNQHFNLAYHERSSSEDAIFRVEDYLDKD